MVKALYQKIIGKIVGKEHRMPIKFHNLGKAESLYSLQNKLVGIDDDMCDKPLESEAMSSIKCIVTAEEVMARKLYCSEMGIFLTAKLIGTSNHVLKSYEKSDGLKRRIIWLPMYNNLEKLNLEEKFFTNLYLTEESIEYWIYLAIEGYKRLYANRKFSCCKAIEEFNEQYFIDNDNTQEFIINLTYSSINNHSVSEIKKKYKMFCEDNDYIPLNGKYLSETIYSHFKLKEKVTTVNGINGRYYK
jgi:putative DNA primase/helicase